MNESAKAKEGSTIPFSQRMFAYSFIFAGILVEILCVLTYFRMHRSNDNDAFFVVCVAILVPMSWPWLRPAWRFPKPVSEGEAARAFPSLNAENLLSSLGASYMALLLTLAVLLGHRPK